MSQKSLGIACGVLLAFAMVVVTRPARADDFDQASQLTFSVPVQLPGNTVLPAGTYWFVLGDPAFAPNIVQIFNGDRTQLITTLMTIPTIRNHRSEDDVLKLAEQSKNRPDALMDWYYNDRLTGHQFIYPKRMEDRLSEDPQITVVASNVPEKSPGELEEESVYIPQQKPKYRARLLNAEDVMQAALNTPDGIPRALLDRARAVVVIPSTVNAALLVGGNYGKGVIVCRTGPDYSGAWGAPAFYNISGGTVGLQAEGETTNYVLLVMNPFTVDKLVHGDVKLGVDATVAAGPVGRKLDVYTAGTDILTYSRTQGLFSGVSLNDSMLQPDSTANARMYGQNAAEIVGQPSADSPNAGQPLDALLNQSSPELVS